MKQILFRDQPVPSLLTVRETAATFTVTPRTVRRWISLGLLPALKFGGVVRVHGDKVAKLLQEGSK